MLPGRRTVNREPLARLAYNPPIATIMRITCAHVVSIVLCEATFSQRARKWHENDQSNNRDNDYHNDHFWIVETLACDHKCSGNIALTGAKSHDALSVNVRSAKQPTNPDPKCNE